MRTSPVEGKLRDRRERAEEKNKAPRKKPAECETPLRVLPSQLIWCAIRSGNADQEYSIGSAPKNQNGSYGDQAERPEFPHQ